MEIRELINELIDVAEERGINPEILRLDERTYKKFKSELKENILLCTGKEVKEIELETYCGISVRVEREVWVNKIHIEIE